MNAPPDALLSAGPGCEPRTRYLIDGLIRCVGGAGKNFRSLVVEVSNGQHEEIGSRGRGVRVEQVEVRLLGIRHHALCDLRADGGIDRVAKMSEADRDESDQCHQRKRDDAQRHRDFHERERGSAKAREFQIRCREKAGDGPGGPALTE